MCTLIFGDQPQTHGVREQHSRNGKPLLHFLLPKIVEPALVNNERSVSKYIMPKQHSCIPDTQTCLAFDMSLNSVYSFFPLSTCTSTLDDFIK